MAVIRAIEGVCEVWWRSGPDAREEAPPDLFIDLPHGATELAHLHAIKRGLRDYPGDEYDLFFLANTDQGSPEYALRLAELLTDPSAWSDPVVQHRAARTKIVLLRSLLPRTIVDVNRVWATQAEAKAAGLTPGVPEFVHEDELEVLHQAFLRYHEQAAIGYASTSGAGGFALNLHTYGPISVSPVEGESIVTTLKRAYTPEHYGDYPVRPVVQLITTPPGGSLLSNGPLCDALVETYALRGIEVARDYPFNLHPATAGYTYAAKYPQRTLTMEISRAALAEVFNPFIEMTICPTKVDHMARPIAEAMTRLWTMALPDQRLT